MGAVWSRPTNAEGNDQLQSLDERRRPFRETVSETDIETFHFVSNVFEHLAKDNNFNLSAEVLCDEMEFWKGGDVVVQTLRGAYGESLLHVIANGGDEYVTFIEPLLNLGVLLDDKDDKGQTPLHEACFGQNNAFVQALLQLGADICVVDEHGMTPLHHVCASISNTYDYENDCWLEIPSPPSLVMVKALCDGGADILTRDHANETPYDWANKIVNVSPGYGAVITYFLDCYAQLICDEYGDHALIYLEEELQKSFSSDGLYADLALGKVSENHVAYLQHTILAKHPSVEIPDEELLACHPPEVPEMDIPRKTQVGHHDFYVIRPMPINGIQGHNYVMKIQYLSVLTDNE